jgi:hypothetical protein
MKAEETIASTSLLKDCFPGSSSEEVHVLVVDMQAHMSASFHLGTRIELRHNTPTRHCQVPQQLVAQVSVHKDAMDKWDDMFGTS